MYFYFLRELDERGKLFMPINSSLEGYLGHLGKCAMIKNDAKMNL